MRLHYVLLVEDDDDLRTLYSFALSNAGFKVKAVRNGLEALTELQDLRPDVILTDLAMPVVDGIELIHRIKYRTELSDIPVIAMTSFGETLQRHARLAGADKAIEKPTKYRAVCDIVTSVLPEP